mgnify:CR=1 FL=1
MSSVALELLRNNLSELNLGFISSYIDTFPTNTLEAINRS